MILTLNTLNDIGTIISNSAGPTYGLPWVYDGMQYASYINVNDNGVS